MPTDELDFGSAISGALQDRGEEDGPPLNFTDGPLSRNAGDDKISLEEAGNLLTLRQLRQGMLDETVTIQEFVKKVAVIHKEIGSLLDIYDLDQVRKELANADEAERLVAEATQLHLETIVNGMERMLNYAKSLDPIDLNEGLEMVEQGFEDLDRSQDEAISILNSLDDDDDDEDEE